MLLFEEKKQEVEKLGQQLLTEVTAVLNSKKPSEKDALQASACSSDTSTDSDDEAAENKEVSAKRAKFINNEEFQKSQQKEFSLKITKNESDLTALKSLMKKTFIVISLY